MDASSNLASNDDSEWLGHLTDTSSFGFPHDTLEDEASHMSIGFVPSEVGNTNNRDNTQTVLLQTSLPEQPWMDAAYSTSPPEIDYLTSLPLDFAETAPSSSDFNLDTRPVRFQSLDDHLN